MLSTEFQKLTGLVLLLRCTLYHRLLGHAMQLMVRTLPVHLSHPLSSSPPALAHCHINISAHCTDYRAPQIRRSKGLTTKEVSAMFTALFTAYCPSSFQYSAQAPQKRIKQETKCCFSQSSLSRSESSCAHDLENNFYVYANLEKIFLLFLSAL